MNAKELIGTRTGTRTWPLVSIPPSNHILIHEELAPYVDGASIDDRHDPAFVTDHFPVMVTFDLADPSVPSDPPSPTAPGDEGGLRLVAVLPNPSGDERTDEAIMIENMGDSVINLDGWSIEDRQQGSWDFAEDGEIPTGETKVIRKNGHNAHLSNSGDRVTLIGLEVDSCEPLRGGVTLGRTSGCGRSDEERCAAERID